MREYKPQLTTSLKSQHKVAVLIGKWNQDYNDQMFQSFSSSAPSLIDIDSFYIPGAFEMPFFAARLAQTGFYSAIVCFGTIIKGDTMHFEIVANESARGIMDVSIKYQIPVINGILACNNSEQARVRASAQDENKGAEMAASLTEILNVLESIPQA